MSLAGLLVNVRDSLFTPACSVCGSLFITDGGTGFPLCPDCADTIERVFHPICPSCGVPSDAVGPGEAICGNCRGTRPGFDLARSAFVYCGAIVALLLRLKHGRCFELARPLGKILAATAATEGIDIADALVPVPTTTARFLKRGYNQSALLARSAAALLGRPVLYRTLVRVGDPGPQGRLSRPERFCRVRDNFAVRDAGPIEGRSIILVDDVITTGATASECARVLKGAGAARVAVVACARAIG